MNKKLIAVAIFLLGSAAQSQSRFGEFSVQENVQGSSDLLLFNGRIVPNTVAEHGYEIVGVKPIYDRVDVALIGSTTGGNSCVFKYFVAFLGAAKFTRTEDFKTCDYPVLDWSVHDDIVEVVLQPQDPAFERTLVIVRDGKAEITNVRLNSFGVERASSGEDVTRWIGKSTFEIFGDASERKRFLEIMSERDLDKLMQHVTLSLGPMTEVQGYVVGTGCQQHACGYNMAAYAIDIESGQPTVLLKDEDAGNLMFGDFTGNLPDVVRDILFDAIKSR